MRKLIGPGGEAHCSKFNCLDEAAVEQVWAVVHPAGTEYNLVMWWCTKHEHKLDRWAYPNYELIREIR